MPHDHDARGILDQLLDGTGHDARLGAGLLLHALGHAAEESEAALRLDRGLVAAAAECHIQALCREGLALLEGRGAVADTDGEGHAVLLVHMDRAGVIQDLELADHQLLHMLLLEDGQESVVLEAAQDAVRAGDERLEQPLDGHADLEPHALLGVLDQVLIVVHDHEHHAGTRALIRAAQAAQLRDVLPEVDGQAAAVLLLIGHGGHAVIALVDADLLLRRTGLERDHVQEAPAEEVGAVDDLVLEELVGLEEDPGFIEDAQSHRQAAHGLELGRLTGLVEPRDVADPAAVGIQQQSDRRSRDHERRDHIIIPEPVPPCIQHGRGDEHAYEHEHDQHPFCGMVFGSQAVTLSLLRSDVRPP